MPDPFVRFIPGHADFSLKSALIRQAIECVVPYPVQHEACRRISRRFKDADMGIPFRIRTMPLPGSPRNPVQDRIGRRTRSL
jgi:hypothetical protein